MRTEHPDFGHEKSLRVMRDMYGLTQSAIAEEIGISPAYVSNAEHQKHIPAYAKQRIELWLSRQEADSREEPK